MINSKLTHQTQTLRWVSLKSAGLAGLLAVSISTFGLAPLAIADSLLATESKGAGNQLTTRHTENTSTKLSAYYSTLQNHKAEGPYYQNSSEVLYSLGLELQKGGQHAKALKALRRAMHITRVNRGLNSLAQAPMLRSIINSQKYLMNFEPVTNSYRQLLRMHMASYGKQDPRLAPLLNELALWHIDAYQFDDSSKRIDHLTSANSLITGALKLNEAHTDPKPREQIQLLRSAALINFHLSRHEGDEWSTSTDSHYSLSADGFASANPQRAGILNGASFRRGRACHERIIDLTAALPNASLEEKLRAQTELADWYLLFNHRQEAMHHYQQVLTHMAASDQAETLHARLFATPHLLPAMRMENHGDRQAALLVTADVDISEKGWGSRIKNIQETLFAKQIPKSKTSLRYLLVDAIKDSRFRPQFVDNKPTYVSDLRVKIPLIH